jgi:hypothetical protein
MAISDNFDTKISVPSSGGSWKFGILRNLLSVKKKKTESLSREVRHILFDDEILHMGAEYSGTHRVMLMRIFHVTFPKQTQSRNHYVTYRCIFIISLYTLPITLRINIFLFNHAFPQLNYSC